MQSNWRPFLAEAIGTFALVFVSAGAVCTSRLPLTPGPIQLDWLMVALASGLMLTVLLPATLHLSGGFLNPALTLTLWVFKRIERPRFAWLIAGQLAGAFLAGLALRLMFADNVLAEARCGTPHLNLAAFGGSEAVGPPVAILLSGIGIEFILTFILTFVIYATLLDHRAPPLGIIAAGLALTGLTLVGYPLTGAALNPARWLGPFLWELTLRPDAAVRDHLVYWVGPTFGALTAGGLYEYGFAPAAERRSDSDRPGSTEAGGPVTGTLYRKK